ncbi:MAG: hypothetical protein ACFB2W_08115 [Leptolyngbyaceae cyanobacterium]
MSSLQRPEYGNYGEAAVHPSVVAAGIQRSPLNLRSSSISDPALLRAARHIYRTYYEVHPEIIERPIGVAIGRTTRRGKLIFGVKPVLLPHESFIPLSQLEPGLH